jgi:glucose-6-phosphate isomerase
LCGIWHRNVCEYSNLALIPYDERLKLLPAWLQQLDMESNGKSTDQFGDQLTYATSPAVIGGVGTVVQHSFFQSLHQGRDVIPVEFIGVLRPEHGLDAHHRLQLGNMLAQGEALMLGRTSDQTRTFLQTTGIGSEQLEKQLPQRILPGNRPSITLLLDELSAYNLGQLMALYEHKIFAQSVIWNTNAFDQWGVEYGKSLASSFETALGSAATETGEAQDLLSFVRQKIGQTLD